MYFPDNEALDVERYQDLARRFLLRANSQQSMWVVRAEGARYWDQSGRCYLDFTSKAACVSMGYNNAALKEALHRQLELGCFSTPYEYNPRQIELAAAMADIAPGGLCRSAFYSSGAEAVEAALKIARRATGRFKVLSLWGGYHGSSEGALAAGGSNRYKGAYEPLGVGYVHIAPPHLRGSISVADQIGLLRAAVQYEDPDHIAAFLVEPLVASRVQALPQEYLLELRRLADEFGIVLIFDEVIPGFGRTGTMFYCEQAGVTPDVLVAAKGMSGSYVPCSVTMTTEQFAQRLGVVGDEAYSHYLSQGIHVVTSQNHAMACASALATIAFIHDNNLLENTRVMGKMIVDGFAALEAEFPQIARPRGYGLLAGVEVVHSEDSTRGDVQLLRRILGETRRNGLAIGGVDDPVNGTTLITAVPPLIVGEAEVNEAVSILRAAIRVAVAA